MKSLIINLIFFVIVVNSNTRKPLFLPQLPVGEFRLNFLGIINCVSIPSNNKLQYNIYLSKMSVNTTEIKGNLTFLIPLDDSLTMEFNMAVKDSIGGWKENAFIYKAAKACSSLKMMLGKSWNSTMAGLGMHGKTCPIPVGTYIAPGVDTGIFLSANFPKSFFYGTYKLRYYYTKNRVVYGCVVLVVQVKRPWEND